MPRGRAFLLVFCCALAVRVPLWWNLSARPDSFERPDTASYMQPARALRAGGGFAVEGRPEANRTPGYPAFLAAHLALGLESPAQIARTQILLDAGTAVLASLAAELAAPGPAAWAFGLLYAFDPLAASHSPLLLTETLFTFLMMVCVTLLLSCGRQPRRTTAALSGLVLGAATLVRPISLYLWLPWSAALWWSRRTQWRTHALVFAIASALPPALWCARNAAAWGEFGFSTVTGTNALIWEAAAVQAAVDQTSLEAGRHKVLDQFATRYPGPINNPFDESRLRRRLAGEILRRHPIQVLRLHVVSTVKMLLGPGMDLVAKSVDPERPLPSEDSLVYSVTGHGTFSVIKARPQLWLALVCIGVILALSYTFGAAGVWRFWESRRYFELAVLGGPLLYLLALSGGGWAYYRFRIPLLPLFAALAAVPFEKKSKKSDAIC